MSFYINKANGREEIEIETIELDRNGDITSVYVHTYENVDDKKSLYINTMIYTDEVSTEGFKLYDILKDNHVKVKMRYSRDSHCYDFDIYCENKKACYFVENEAMYSMPIRPALLRCAANKLSFIIEDLYRTDNDYLISTNNVYGSEDTCLKYNKVKTTDLNGNVTYQGGEALLLEFTEDQKSALEDLIEQINKCIKMGIGFRHSDYNDLMAYRMDIHDDRYDEIVMEYDIERKEDDVDMTDYVNPYHVMCLDDFDPCNSYEAVLRRRNNEKDI